MQDSTTPSVSQETFQLLRKLGVAHEAYVAGHCTVYSPISGNAIGPVPCSTRADTATAISRAHEASDTWQAEEGDRRGQLATLIGEELQKVRGSLERLMVLELGNSPAQSAADLREMIVVCGFAARIARQGHRPGRCSAGADADSAKPASSRCTCGVKWVGSLSDGILAMARGAAVLWVPAQAAPLTALAIHAAVLRAIARFGAAPDGLLELLLTSRAFADLLNASGVCRHCGGTQTQPRVAKAKAVAAAPASVPRAPRVEAHVEAHAHAHAHEDER